MRTPAALPFCLIDVQTLTDSLDVRFACTGDHGPRAAALTQFERETRQVYGQRALYMFASSAAETCGWLEVPLALTPDLPAAAALISAGTRRVGLQPFVLPVLDAQVAQDLRNQLGLARLSDPLSVDVAAYLAATAAVQARWAAAIDPYLALDAASGSCSHPGLVRELHIGRPPLEHWVLRALLGDTATIGRGRAKRLSYWDGFSFADVPLAQMEPPWWPWPIRAGPSRLVSIRPARASPWHAGRCCAGWRSASCARCRPRCCRFPEARVLRSDGVSGRFGPAPEAEVFGPGLP